jgi:hypothetical protein
MLDEDQRNVVGVDQDRADQGSSDDGVVVMFGDRPADQHRRREVGRFVERPGDKQPRLRPRKDPIDSQYDAGEQLRPAHEAFPYQRRMRHGLCRCSTHHIGRSWRALYTLTLRPDRGV